ncbi:class F sortase [Geodermatophilus sp. SYSU D00710]
MTLPARHRAPQRGTRYRTPHRRRSPLLPVVLTVLALGAVAVALLVPGSPPEAAAGASAATAPAASVPGPVVLAAQPTAPATVPVRVRVPAAGVDGGLVELGLDPAGALAVPADPSLAGWYAAGPVPGEVGPAVLAGHVDSARGPAVFARLAGIGPGDEVLVDRSDGTSVRFAVTRVERHPKGAFPTEEVYGPTPDAQLRLVTCGGAFDRSRGSYEDNVVVFATLVS